MKNYKYNSKNCLFLQFKKTKTKTNSDKQKAKVRRLQYCMFFLENISCSQNVQLENDNLSLYTFYLAIFAKTENNNWNLKNGEKQVQTDTLNFYIFLMVPTKK